MPDDDMLTISEAAAHLKVHPNTLRNWADKGIVPVHKLPSGYRRFRASDVEAMVEQQNVEIDRQIHKQQEFRWTSYSRDLEQFIVDHWDNRETFGLSASQLLDNFRSGRNLPPREKGDQEKP